MSGANSCAAKQATPIPRQQDMCSEAPRETGDTFLLFSPDAGITSPQSFWHISDANRQAERIARGNRGSRVILARVIATVIEPLPNLEWTDGMAESSGQRRSDTLSLGGQHSVTQGPRTLQEQEQKHNR